MGDLLTAFSLALGFDSRQIGLLNSVCRFAGFIQLFTNHLVDRIGSKKRLYYYLFGTHYFIGIIVALLPSIRAFFPFYNVVWYLISLMFIINCVDSIGIVLKKVWMSELTPVEIRGRYFGLRSLLLGIFGMAVGYLSSLYVDYWRGMDKGMFGFQSLFLASSLMGFSTLVIVAMIPDSSSGPKKQNLKEFFLNFQKPFKNKPFATWMLFYGCYNFGVGFAGPFFTVYLLKELNLPLATVAVYTAIGEISSIALSRFWGSLADKYGNRTVLIIACIGKSIFPALWILTSGANTFWAIAWLGFVHSVRGFNSAQNITSLNMVLWLSPDESKPVYLACESTIINLAAAISPLIGGLILGAMTGKNAEISLFGWDHTLCAIHILFLISAVLRGLSSLILIWVKSDPK